tara:strand:- start:492 stop:758 length:267 start_codon:yes stop_codon:yes gene_type:complete
VILVITLIAILPLGDFISGVIPMIDFYEDSGCGEAPPSPCCGEASWVTEEELYDGEGWDDEEEWIEACVGDGDSEEKCRSILSKLKEE